jgi:ATP synthase protein I
MTLEPPSKRAARFARELALAMELPFVLVGTVLTGGFSGFLLDRWLGTAPLFLIVLGILGTYAGIREIVRRLPKGNSKSKSGE